MFNDHPVEQRGNGVEAADVQACREQMYKVSLYSEKTCRETRGSRWDLGPDLKILPLTSHNKFKKYPLAFVIT